MTARNWLITGTSSGFGRELATLWGSETRFGVPCGSQPAA